MVIAKEVARKLLQINAIKLSPQKPFTWASGMHAPIYCDNRTILSFPSIRSFVIDAFREESKAFQPFDQIAGVATAGIAHGALLADRMDLPFLYVRSKPKGHGRQNLIEGVLRGEKALVIEDLISTGGSSVAAVRALREAGCQVAGVLAIFSYGFEKAKVVFEDAGCRFLTLSNYDVLLQEALETGYIGPDDEQTLREWRHDPPAWSERHRH